MNVSISTAVGMAQTAVREPEKVPPFLRQQAGYPRRWWATKRATALLDDQRERLDALRESGEYLLIVLDACRYDVFTGVFAEFFHGEVEPIRSAGHDTFEYARLCWPDQHDVTYCSGATPINDKDIDYEDGFFNELYNGYVPAEHLGEIVDVWDTGWDESLGTCPPAAVTDAALARRDESQLVGHYFQPHAPYIGDRRLLGHTDSPDAHPHAGDPIDKPVWDAVKSGEISVAELRAVYQSNLICALHEVCRLVNRADHERVVIMGDHGEALGKYDTYAHPRTPHPHIRRVPWATVDGLTDYGERVAEEAGGSHDETGERDQDVKGRLEQLGYI